MIEATAELGAKAQRQRRARLLRQLADALVDHFGDLLRRAGLLDRKRQAQQNEEDDGPENHQQLQCKGVVDRCGGMGGRNAHQLQESVHRAGKKAV